jgi:hypothetical protein
MQIMPTRRAITLAALALALALVVVSPGSAQTKAGSTDHPVTGHLVGVGSPTSALPPGNYFGGEQTGVISGLSSRRVAYQAQGTYAKNGSGTYDLTGTVIIVTKSGAAVTGTYHGTTSTGVHVAATVHITGGSGRFADASGTWKQTDHNTQTPGQTFPNQSAITIKKGHISY